MSRSIFNTLIYFFIILEIRLAEFETKVKEVRKESTLVDDQMKKKYEDQGKKEEYVKKSQVS